MYHKVGWREYDDPELIVQAEDIEHKVAKSNQRDRPNPRLSK
jgi:hypothetical protein